MQRLTGCELLGDGDEGRLIFMQAFDGESGDVVSYNRHKGTFVTEWKWPFIYEAYAITLKYEVKELFHPLCMKVCRKYLQREKNRIEKQGSLYIFYLCCYNLSGN